jgi:hypothetical protein
MILLIYLKCIIEQQLNGATLNLDGFSIGLEMSLKAFSNNKLNIDTFRYLGS